MYTVSHTVIMCVPACLQVLKTTLDSLLGTCESQRKGDNSNVDLVTHNEAFLSIFFFWAVCTGLLSRRAHVHVSTAEEQDPAQDGPIKTCGENVFTAKYLQSRAQPHWQLDVVDGVVGRGLIQVWAADGLGEGASA